MKKVIQILLICLMISGIIVICTAGFNVGLKYAENTQIDINIGKEFKTEDVKSIAKEVFKNKRVMVEQVELYKDMAQITVKDASDEEINELNTKMNEKYELDNEISDIDVIKNSNTKLRYLVKPYILPIAISVALIVVYGMIIFKKQGIWKVLYKMLIAIVEPQAILFSLYAVTRLPINRLTSVISIALYIGSVVFIFNELSNSKLDEKKIKKVKKSKKANK